MVEKRTLVNLTISGKKKTNYFTLSETDLIHPRSNWIELDIFFKDFETLKKN